MPQHRMKTRAHLKNTTLPATLTSEHTDLRKVYLGCGCTNGGEDILELVDDVDNLCSET